MRRLSSASCIKVWDIEFFRYICTYLFYQILRQEINRGMLNKFNRWVCSRNIFRLHLCLDLLYSFDILQKWSRFHYKISSNMHKCPRVSEYACQLSYITNPCCWHLLIGVVHGAILLFILHHCRANLIYSFWEMTHNLALSPFWTSWVYSNPRSRWLVNSCLHNNRRLPNTSVYQFYSQLACVSGISQCCFMLGSFYFIFCFVFVLERRTSINKLQDSCSCICMS